MHELEFAHSQSAGLAANNATLVDLLFVSTLPPSATDLSPRSAATPSPKRVHILSGSS
jgi:hypothetical protein